MDLLLLIAAGQQATENFGAALRVDLRNEVHDPRLVIVPVGAHAALHIIFKVLAQDAQP